MKRQAIFAPVAHGFHSVVTGGVDGAGTAASTQIAIAPRRGRRQRENDTIDPATPGLPHHTPDSESDEDEDKDGDK
ncbi:hypothetical protein F4809DRAFT_644843 [Biscogniauxia mediterranea]|nr:hypothetical protein F4809DRAFT_644843 [Biscogniauxia mediterranea]